MLSATKKCPIGLSTFKDHTDLFTPKPWFNNLQVVTDEQVSQVEKETKDQAACKAWHHHRAGWITSSSAHRVTHTSLEEPSQALIKDLCKSRSVDNQLKTPCILWGKDHEVDIQISIRSEHCHITNLYKASIRPGIQDAL